MLCRSSGERPAVLAITASRTLSGSGASGWSRIWLTKNGLPAVRRCTSAGSSWWPSSSSATAARLSGVSCMRRTPGVATRSPTTGLSAGSAPTVSRHDTIISNGSASMRRARKRTRSVVASSAQCRSSTTSTRGVSRKASSTAAKISCWAAASRRPRGDGGPEPARDVAQRAERARGAQRVAHAPQHRHRHPLGERAEQRRLADARLTRRATPLRRDPPPPARPGSAARRSGVRAPAAAPVKCKPWSAPLRSR